VSKYQRFFLIIIVLAIIAGAVVYQKPMKRGLDLAGGMRVVLQARPQKGQKLDKDLLSAAVLTVENRVNKFGVSEPVVQRKGLDQIIVELPEITDKDKALARLQRTGSLEFYHLKDVNDSEGRGRNKFARWVYSVSEKEFTHSRTPGSRVRSRSVTPRRSNGCDRRGHQAILTGRDLVPGETSVEMGRGGAGVIVSLVFKKEAQRKFAQFTRLNVHEFLAITLDDVILTAPRINEAIRGTLS